MFAAPAPALAPAPAQTRWTRVELRADVVRSGPQVPPTLAGFRRLATELGIGTGPVEDVWAAAVDEHAVRSMALVARGQRLQVGVALPPILAVPLLAGTDKLVLLHTHPSDPPIPSGYDLELTSAVMAAANACGMWLVDHIIVANDGRMASLRAAGHLG